IQVEFDPLLVGFKYVDFNDAEALRAAISKETCGIMLEAIQGEGGVNPATPEFMQTVAELCRERGVPYYPGCVTPTEIMAALELGITTVKFFPANVYGGLAALRALSAPFPQVRFIPTGGVDRANIDEFLAFDKVAAIGGSFFVKEALAKMEEK
ncbi:MAG: aminotransferase class III-fold pyridoxal phosphate-dependent enzyme, partial [Clostridia bacterium]|nr:aminotransferase class III-fold pyridoxal phosphate-dependent enzyme [Clostridia bacterium]